MKYTTTIVYRANYKEIVAKKSYLTNKYYSNTN